MFVLYHPNHLNHPPEDAPQPSGQHVGSRSLPPGRAELQRAVHSHGMSRATTDGRHEDQANTLGNYGVDVRK